VILPVLVLVFAHALGAPPPPGEVWLGPPFTLRPQAPRSGDPLVCAVGSGFREWPDPAAPLRCERAAGGTVRVAGWTVLAGVPWIATMDGWVEAARLDRPAARIERELPVGREGMAAGRVLPADWRPPDLRVVPDSLKAPGLEWRRMELTAGALEAFRAMIAAAADDGVRIGIYSAYRTVEYQRDLYARAVDRDPRQRSSAAPGRSEHHLGTTADVATPGVTPLRAEIAGSPAGRWLEARARDFGIVATYSLSRHAARGAAHEPWHLRWVGEGGEDESAW
jgi:hypothetical protein